MPATDGHNKITAKEAAEKLGLNRSRVQRFIQQQRLPAMDAATGLMNTEMDMENRNGRRVSLWLIDPKDLAKVKNRKTGWPEGRPRGARVLHGPKCKATTKHDKPCQNPAGDSGYCHKHPNG